MAISKLQGTFKLPNPRLRTKVSSQALAAKKLNRGRKLSPLAYGGETFPSIRRIVRGIPEEYLLISVAQRMRRQQGSVSLKLLLGLAGAIPGFLAGSTFQFEQLKGYIAREAGLGIEQLAYLDFLTNPGMSIRDYGSMMAAGAVGAFFTGVLSSGLPELLSQTNNGPGGS